MDWLQTPCVLNNSNISTEKVNRHRCTPFYVCVAYIDGVWKKCKSFISCGAYIGN